MTTKTPSLGVKEWLEPSFPSLQDFSDISDIETQTITVNNTERFLATLIDHLHAQNTQQVHQK